MTEVIVKDKIRASAASVWELAGNFGDMSWAKLECKVEGEGVGAIRTLTMPGGATIRERLEAHDPAGFSFTYSILGDSPLPVSNYKATVTLSGDGSDACAIDWRGSFEPKGPEEKASAVVEGIYKNGIQSFKTALEPK